MYIDLGRVDSAGGAKSSKHIQDMGYEAAPEV